MGGKAPPPPDPKETAAAQTGTNVSTAIANAALQNVNQVTPDGTLTYAETGTTNIFDPSTGQRYDVPTYTATQTLSDAQQGIKDRTDAAETNLAEIARDQSEFLGDYLKEPVNLDNEAVEQRLYDLGSKRLDPRFERQREATETRLANQGIMRGTEAYDREMEAFEQSRNDAYNQLALGGRQQAVQEALTARNQPINEISALLSGSQVSQPNFVNTNQPSIPTTNYAGIVNQAYEQQLGQWQQRQAGMGGLFAGLGQGLGTILALSDKRAKKDVKKVGKLDGHNLYRYRYKGEPAGSPKTTGVMAQEVEKTRPDAVVKAPDGTRMVSYGTLFAPHRGTS